VWQRCPHADATSRAAFVGLTQIAGMRDQLTHAYFGVDLGLV
jgi:uncharacterized protein with HEPN domain